MIPIHEHWLQHRLYTYLISHFADILRVFSQNTPQNTKHPLHTFRISFKFHDREEINYKIILTFCENAAPGSKWCEIQKKKNNTWNVKKMLRNTPLDQLYTYRKIYKNDCEKQDILRHFFRISWSFFLHFTLLFSLFAFCNILYQDQHSCEKSKDFVVYFFAVLIKHEICMKYEKSILSVSYFTVCFVKTFVKYPWNAKYEKCIHSLIHFSFFAFCRHFMQFCIKCIAGLKEDVRKK